MRLTTIGIFLVFISNYFSQEYISVENFMDVRCYSNNNEQVYFQWRGDAYVQKPAEKEKLVFKVLGMNVARCFKNPRGYSLVTREIQFYLDPNSSEIIDQWTNPWTDETLPVMHAANSPVQIPLSSKMALPLDQLGPSQSVGLYFPLAYKNPLNDIEFEDYAPYEWYQASEMFRFIFSADDSAKVGLVWNRVGQFLPWMKMRDQKGILKIVAHGQRFENFKDLESKLQQAIRDRAPSYQNAPECVVEQKNATSWTEFAKHFDAYLEGATFPIDAEPLNCSEKIGSE